MSAVDTIIANAIAIANEQSANLTDAITVATEVAQGGISLSTPTVTMPTPITPDEQHVAAHQNIGVYIPQTADPAAIYNNFNQIYAQIHAQAVADLASYLTTYFPPTPSWDDALAWLDATINLNGNNFQSVETPMWANGRNRILNEELSLENATYTRFAARGFPLYGGEADSAIREIQLKRQDKLAELSNQIAIKHLDISLDLIKFSVEQAIKARIESMRLAIEYIRALLEPADVASRFVFQSAGLQAQLIHAVGSYYTALLEKDKLLLESAKVSAEINMQYMGLGVRLNETSIAARSQAAVGGARAAAEGLKGAESSLNGIASYTESV